MVDTLAWGEIFLGMLMVAVGFVAFWIIVSIRDDMDRFSIIPGTITILGFYIAALMPKSDKGQHATVITVICVLLLEVGLTIFLVSQVVHMVKCDKFKLEVYRRRREY